MKKKDLTKMSTEEFLIYIEEQRSKAVKKANKKIKNINRRG